MVSGMKHILFASNLSENSRHAFTYAAMLAMQFRCRISLLHIIENLPQSVEYQLEGIFGKSGWEEILQNRIQSAQDLLVGKISKKEMIRAALSQFCFETGINTDECGYVDSDIIIKEGDVIDSILDYAAQEECDLIVMGASEGFVTKYSVGKKIKSIMKKAKVPVMVVPHKE